MSSKLESDVCCHLQVAPSGESYEESNGRLLLGIWRDSLHVTCGLTACTPGSAPGPTLGNEYGKSLPFLPSTSKQVQVANGKMRYQSKFQMQQQIHDYFVQLNLILHLQLLHGVTTIYYYTTGGSVAEWLAC